MRSFCEFFLLTFLLNFSTSGLERDYENVTSKTKKIIHCDKKPIRLGIWTDGLCLVMIACHARVIIFVLWELIFLFTVKKELKSGKLEWGTQGTQRREKRFHSPVHTVSTCAVTILGSFYSHLVECCSTTIQIWCMGFT